MLENFWELEKESQYQQINEKSYQQSLCGYIQICREQRFYIKFIKLKFIVSDPIKTLFVCCGGWSHEIVLKNGNKNNRQTQRKIDMEDPNTQKPIRKMSWLLIPELNIKLI